jgi:hypothetical protein
LTTLTYGLKLPASGDRGATLFAALEGNINQLDAHNHNGTNSPKLPGSSITGTVVPAGAGSWIADVNGMHYQTVTLGSGYDFDKQQILVKLTSTKEYVYPKMERVSASQVKVWTNDNTVGFDLLVGG